jgi:hypothetical protein
MCNAKAVLTIILIIAVRGICLTDEAIVVKVPPKMLINDYVCIEDYIWYSAEYDDNSNLPSYGIGRLHVPSQKGIFFTDKELKLSAISVLTRLAAVDSNFAAFLLGVKVTYYNGTEWNFLSDPADRIKNILAIPSSGKIWLLSSNSIIILDKSGKTKTITKDITGVSDSLLGFTKDISDNVWVFSRHQVARFDKTSWKVMINNDTMNFSGIDLTTDGKICILSDGRYFTLTDDLLDTIASPVSLRNSNSNVDESGNVWNFIVDSSFNNSLQMITADSKKITFQNAKASGWTNWPEFVAATADSAIRIWGKHVYFRYYNGFYYYNGENSKLEWKWIPVNTSTSLLYAPRNGIHILPSRDSSIYIENNSSRPLVVLIEIVKLKSGIFQTLPPQKLTSAPNIFEDHTGTLWAFGKNAYRLENSVWTQVQIPSNAAIRTPTQDSQGRVVLIAKTLNQGVNDTIILRWSGSDWETVNDTNEILRLTSKCVQDLSGVYWKLSDNGLYKSTDLYQWTKEDKPGMFLPEAYVTSLNVDSKKNIIVAIQSDDSMGATADVVRYDGTKWESLGLPAKTVSNGKLYGGKNGGFWYRAYYNYTGTTLLFFDSEGWHSVDSSHSISDVQVDSLNQAWICTSGDGVYKYASENVMVTRGMYQSPKSHQLSVNNSGYGNATIMYRVDKSADVSLEVFTLQGKSVAVLKKGFQEKGEHIINWNYKRATGTYILRLTAPGTVYALQFRTF